MLPGLVRLVRPKQWIKNVLVFAAPFAAGSILEPRVMGRAVLAFVCFSLASSATYAVNDVRDAAADALHPVKRSRPVPSGAVSKPAALGTAGVLAVLALGLAALGRRELLWAVLAYLVITLAYTLLLKEQPVVELGLVSAGFILRAIGGGAATGIALSHWFLIVAGFGSLFMVTGKRLSERSWAESAATRKALAAYPISFLETVLGVSAAVAIMGYCLWAAEVGAAHGHALWTWVSIAPFVIAILRYALDTHHGHAEEPEQLVLGDRTLIGLGIVWIVTYALGVLL